MTYFSEGETVYINSALFPELDEGVIVSVPLEDETFYDVRIIKSEQVERYGVIVPLVEDELTKFTDE